MKTIFKYPIPLQDYFTLLLPEGAEILTAQTQHDRPQIWAIVKKTAPLQERWYRLVGTGHDFSDAHCRYIATFQMHAGSLVFHLFELLEH